MIRLQYDQTTNFIYISVNIALSQFITHSHPEKMFIYNEKKFSNLTTY